MPTKNNRTQILDKEEQLIEELLEKDQFVSSNDLADIKVNFKKAAQKFQELQKSKRVTIRINQLDLLKVKAKAKQNRIPYQTLLGSLIHQYAQGKTKLSL